MSDVQQRLAELRGRIARINEKYAAMPRSGPPASRPNRPERYHPEDWLNGTEVETDFGRHYEFEKLFPRHRRHGSFGICDLEDLPKDFLAPISEGKISEVPPQKWCFLDTETTGIAGAAGTYAFLIGVGRIAADGFRVRQFFMREFGEEPSLLHAVADHLAQFEVLITYNGRRYDQPLLESRFWFTRMRPPFGHVEHVDLLFGARRLWKLRFENCRLIELENRILGVERDGDLPGEMIPYVYFNYLRDQEIDRLLPIFHHNQIDVLSLACLAAVVPLAFHEPSQVRWGHGAEMVGLARWWRQAEHFENALTLFRQAVDRDLPDDVLFRTLWDIACLEKSTGRAVSAVSTLTEIAACRNEWQAAALEELAKYYEHREKNIPMAMEMTRQALNIGENEALQRRAERLERRLARGARNRA